MLFGEGATTMAGYANASAAGAANWRPSDNATPLAHGEIGPNDSKLNKWTMPRTNNQDNNNGYKPAFSSSSEHFWGGQGPGGGHDSPQSHSFHHPEAQFQQQQQQLQGNKLLDFSGNGRHPSSFGHEMSFNPSHHSPQWGREVNQSTPWDVGGGGGGGGAGPPAWNANAGGGGGSGKWEPGKLDNSHLDGGQGHYGLGSNGLRSSASSGVHGGGAGFYGGGGGGQGGQGGSPWIPPPPQQMMSQQLGGGGRDPMGGMGGPPHHFPAHQHPNNQLWGGGGGGGLPDGGPFGRDSHNPRHYNQQQQQHFNPAPPPPPMVGAFGPGMPSMGMMAPPPPPPMHGGMMHQPSFRPLQQGQHMAPAGMMHHHAHPPQMGGGGQMGAFGGMGLPGHPSLGGGHPPGMMHGGEQSDSVWQDPDGTLKKWQRDTGTGLWGDPSKHNEQQIQRWQQFSEEEEETVCQHPQTSKSISMDSPNSPRSSSNNLSGNNGNSNSNKCLGWGDLPLDGGDKAKSPSGADAWKADSKEFNVPHRRHTGFENLHHQSEWEPSSSSVFPIPSPLGAGPKHHQSLPKVSLAEELSAMNLDEINPNGGGGASAGNHNRGPPNLGSPSLW